MKMNARKLTIALIALLLALTCVFVACKKDPEPEPKPVDNKTNEEQKNDTPPTPDPVTHSQEDLAAIAAQFKKDYDANYLSLYTDAVATQLEAMKSEAILKITGSASKEEGQKLADAYIEQLKSARTIVNEVEDLIKKIAKDGDNKNEADPAKGVALADKDDVALLSQYNALVEAHFLTAAGAQKPIIDAYKAKTWGIVKDIEKRLKTLEVAKLAADAENGVNAEILDILLRATQAEPHTIDGTFENDPKKLTLKEYEDLLKIQAKVDTFAEMHELVEGTEAYAEILKKPELDEADRLFAEKTANNRQIFRARRVIETAKDLAAAARVAARYLPDTADEGKLVYVNAEDVETNAPRSANDPIYFILIAKFEAGSDTVLPPESMVNPIKVTAYWDEIGAIVNNPKSVWVEKADVYADLLTAYTALNTIEVMEVTISGDTGARNPFMIQIPNTRTLSHYILDADLQAKAEAAEAAATAWAELLPQTGNADLKETIANRFFYDVIVTILNQYNGSLATAVAAYNEFAAALVEKNYVNEYPVKADDFAEYVLTTDTQTVPETLTTKRWKALIEDEFAALMLTAKTLYHQNNTNVLIANLFALVDLNNVPNAEYPFYKLAQQYMGQGNNLTLHDNGDGTFTPSIEYKVFVYRWLVDILSKEDKEIVTTANTDVIATVIADVNDYFFHGGKGGTYNAEVNYYKLSQKLVAWAEKYLEIDPEAEEIDIDVFDLAPFMTVKSNKVCKNTAAVKFGNVKMTFADEKLEEEALPQIVELNGEAVDATPSAALDITVFADYTVAKKAIAEFDRLTQELKDTAAGLKADLRALFALGEADAIKALKAAYEAAMAKYATCVLDDVTVDPADVMNSLEEELKRIDQYNWNRYATVLATAVALQNRVLALYPHAEWDAALTAPKAAYEAAKANADKMDAFLAEYDELLADARAWLEHCEAGYSIGWTADRTTSHDVWVVVTEEDGTQVGRWKTVTVPATEEVRLVDEATLKAAQLKVEVLEKWRDILADASKFIVVNDARCAALVTDDVTRDPAALANITVEALTADLGTYITSEALRNYMINVLIDAKASVTYKLSEANGVHANANYVVIGNSVYVVLTSAKLDKIALDNVLAEKETAYEDAKTTMVETFKLDGKKSYADIIELDKLIADIDDFTDHAIIVSENAPIYADYDYLNLAVTNEYTGNKIDLFSQLFNERIMAGYYRSILVTIEYARRKGNVDALYQIDVTEDYKETSWVEYAVNELNTDVESTDIFESIDAAKEAVEASWRTDYINYEWAVMAINKFFGGAKEVDYDFDAHDADAPSVKDPDAPTAYDAYTVGDGTAATRDQLVTANPDALKDYPYTVDLDGNGTRETTKFDHRYQADINGDDKLETLILPLYPKDEIPAFNAADPANP